MRELAPLRSAEEEDRMLNDNGGGNNSFPISQSTTSQVPETRIAADLDTDPRKTETAESLKKEEEEFAKLEALFMNELNITHGSPSPEYSPVLHRQSSGLLKMKK